MVDGPLCTIARSTYLWVFVYIFTPKPQRLSVLSTMRSNLYTFCEYHTFLIVIYLNEFLLFPDGTLIKCEKTYEMCEGCGQKIHDRYLMRVADASWHEHCLSCCICGVLLNHSCYTRNTKLYCKADYDRYALNS